MGQLPIVNGDVGDKSVMIAGVGLLAIIGAITAVVIDGKPIPAELTVIGSSLLTFLIGTRVVTSDTTRRVKHGDTTPDPDPKP